MTSFRDMVRAELMEMQQGRCAICPSTGPFVIDHDHETGLVRGLLCRACNSREGQCLSREFHVYPDAAMLAYLANPPAAGKGWQWDIPDPRRNPARMEADYWAAWDLVQKIPLWSPDAPVPAPQVNEPEAVEAADELEPPVIEVTYGPVPGPRRKCRPKVTPVTIEEAITELQTINLPTLTL